MGHVTDAAKQPGRDAHNHRPNRESIAKAIGSRALQIKARDGHKCSYCSATERSEQRAGRKMHLDHVTPKKDGGTLQNKNILLSCHRCNSIKKKLTWKAWIDAAYVRGIRFNAAAILTRLKGPVPTMEESRVAQAKVHEQFAADHAKHDSPMHKHAADLNKIAARVLRTGGGWASKAVKQARSVSTHVWQMGPKGGKFVLSGHGKKEYVR